MKTSDSGSCANWYARDINMRPDVIARYRLDLPLGAVVPHAIAAKFAHPDRLVIGLVGLGGLHMNNMAEMITVANIG